MDSTTAVRIAALALAFFSSISACAAAGVFFGLGWFFLFLSVALLASSAVAFSALRDLRDILNRKR